MNNSKHITEDEIDLRELWQTMVKAKLFILSFTILVTLVTAIYVYTKTFIPIYSGSLLVEIGEIKTNRKSNVYFDNVNNLKHIIERKFNSSVATPSDKLILINIKHTDKNKIKTDISNIYTFVLNRHQEKTKLYKQYIMTKQIADVVIDDIPSNQPKNKLIIAVAFITSMILSIFIVFFMAFIKEESTNEIL